MALHTSLGRSFLVLGASKAKLSPKCLTYRVRIALLTAQICIISSNSNSTFIALNLYLMIDSKTQKAKIRDRNH